MTDRSSENPQTPRTGGGSPLSDAPTSAPEGRRTFQVHGEPTERHVPYSFEEPLACPIGEEKGKQHFWDDPTRVKWLLRILYAACAILFAIDFLFHRHVEHPLEGWWGFYPLYGFISCTLLVLVAKEMRKVLMRADDYYDGD